MENKNANTYNQLLFRILFFFIFSLFFIFSNTRLFSQPRVLGYESLLTHDFRADSVKSDELFALGIEAYSQEDNQTALTCFLKSWYIRKNIFADNDISLVYPLMRAGAVYKELGMFIEAIECYLEAEKIYIKNYGPDTYRLGLLYNNLGNVYRPKGNFSEAIRYHKQAINRFSSGDTMLYKMIIHDTKYNLAENLFLTGQYEESLNTILPCYENSEYDQKAVFLFLLGSIHDKLHNNTKADEYFRLSIETLNAHLAGIRDSISLANLHIGYANFLISMNRYKKAEVNLESARPLLSGFLSGRDISGWYHSMGTLYAAKEVDSGSLAAFRSRKSRNLDTALNCFQRAILALSDFTHSDPSVNPRMEECRFPASTLTVLQSKAETYYELSQLRKDGSSEQQAALKNALSAARLASDLLNHVRTGAVNEESKMVITQLQNPIYLLSIKIAYELYTLTGQVEYFETAFQNSERNKAASLLDNLTEKSAMHAGFLPDSLIRREENINGRISYYTQQIFEEREKKKPDTVKINRFEEYLFQLNHDQNELERSLEQNFPTYYRLKYTDAPVSIADLRKVLSKNEVILEYVLDRETNPDQDLSLYQFMVSKEEFCFRKTPVDSLFIRNIRFVHQFLSDPDYVNITTEEYIHYLEAAHGLYQILIQPWESRIRNQSITLIPDDLLHYIPFDALLSTLPSEADTLNFKDLDYLVRSHAFNYSYSAYLYMNRSNNQKRANKNILAFAPDYGTSHAFADAEYLQLSPLTGIREEVSALSEYPKTRLYTGEQATETHFREEAADYDILHLAMHAIIHDSLPMFSKLAFAPESPASGTSPGWLYTEEIYNLNLKARLSVLSACNTGSGTLKEGEGVISLARGFFYAGCPAVVMTLWEVEDRSGAEIMRQFYRFLQSGKKKHEALRMAKLKHLEKANPVTAHPHVWLCYVTIGNSDALYTSWDFYFFLILLGVLAGILTDQLVRKKKARKTRA
jgi:CHAT domain-containing protein